MRQEIIDRYPGWVPKNCLDCRNGEKAAASVTKNADHTLDEVRQRFSGGPQTGVFTDGASEGNPGPGGWGAVYVIDGEIIEEARGHDPYTTNNRMELTALIAGYRLIPEDAAITIYTDSQLIVNIITKWARGWEERGWRRKTGPIANLELVQEAYELSKARPQSRLVWIKAHSGYLWNEYADALATAYRRQIR